MTMIVFRKPAQDLFWLTDEQKGMQAATIRIVTNSNFTSPPLTEQLAFCTFKEEGETTRQYRTRLKNGLIADLVERLKAEPIEVE